MKNDKILNNEELNEVTGGALLWNEKKKLFAVGDEVIAILDAGLDLESVEKVSGIITECLGIEGIFIGTYEYMVQLDNGSTKKVTQSRLMRK